MRKKQSGKFKNIHKNIFINLFVFKNFFHKFFVKGNNICFCHIIYMSEFQHAFEKENLKKSCFLTFAFRVPIKYFESATPELGQLADCKRKNV